MIVYADSSVLARAYLVDEPGQQEARAMLEDTDTVLVTGSWTRIEVTGVLVRAAKAHRGVRDGLLRLWEADIAPEGPVTVLSVPQHEAEQRALRIVKDHGLGAMDAWHVVVAAMTVPDLAAGEPFGFASRDLAQAEVARLLGFEPVCSTRRRSTT